MTTKFQFGSGPDGKDEWELRKAAGDGAEQDANLEQALVDFRASIRGWSEAAYFRARTVEMTVRRRSWRLAAGWALGCALLAGGVTAGMMEHQHQQEDARIAAAEQQAQQQEAAAARQRARQQDQNLLARVDSDTSQEVPDAMEPLAQLMEEGGTQ